MSCFLPPLCLFCDHFNHSDDADVSLSCKAFEQIPDSIFLDEILHTRHIEGDNNILFKINPEMIDEYNDVNELRMAMDMQAFPELKQSAPA